MSKQSDEIEERAMKLSALPEDDEDTSWLSVPETPMHRLHRLQKKLTPEQRAIRMDNLTAGLESIDNDPEAP